MKLRNKKTGEIIDSKEILTCEFIINLFSKDFNHFNSELDKIQEEWEDVKEPLIKNEEIRKAVKAWADINSVKITTYDEIPQDRGLNKFFFEDNEKENALIQFYGWIPTLKEGEIHTITELCGEEEWM